MTDEYQVVTEGQGDPSLPWKIATGVLAVGLAAALAFAALAASQRNETQAADEQQIRTLQGAVADLESENTELRASLESESAEISKGSGRIGQLEAEAAKLGRQLAKAEKQASDRQARIDALKGEIAAQKTAAANAQADAKAAAAKAEAEAQAKLASVEASLRRQKEKNRAAVSCATVLNSGLEVVASQTEPAAITSSANQALRQAAATCRGVLP